MDPLGLIEEDAVTLDRAVYSCNCGWIDWTHAGGKDYDILNKRKGDCGPAILAESGKPSLLGGGYYAAFYQSQRIWGIGMSHWGQFFVKSGLRPDQKASVAMAIFQDVSYGFEQMQDRYNWPVEMIGFRPSGFAEEDLPSDLILFYRVFRHYETV